MFPSTRYGDLLDRDSAPQARLSHSDTPEFATPNGIQGTSQQDGVDCHVSKTLELHSVRTTEPSEGCARVLHQPFVDKLLSNAAPTDHIDSDNAIWSCADPTCCCKSSDTHKRNICAVCVDVLQDSAHARQLQCRHIFHTACIDPWLTAYHAYCPLCKRSCCADTALDSDDTCAEYAISTAVPPSLATSATSD